MSVFNLQRLHDVCIDYAGKCCVYHLEMVGANSLVSNRVSFCASKLCFDLLSSNRNKSKKKQLKPIIKGIILNHLFATKKQIHLLNSFPIPSYMVHTRSSFDNTSRVKVTGSSRRMRRCVTLTGRVEVDEVARTELGTGRPRWSIVPAKPAIPVTATEVA